MAQHSRASINTSSSLCLGSTSLDEQNVAVLDNVVLALGHDLALCLDSGFVTLFPQCLVVVHNSLDKCLFKVTVNHTGSLWRLGANPYCPLSDLVGTSCEEAAKLESLAHRLNGLGKRRLGAQVLELLSCLGIRHDSKALLKLNGDGDDWVARGVGLDPLGNLGKMLVLLADVVLLAQVDKVYNGLSGEEEERVDVLDLANRQQKFAKKSKCNANRECILRIRVGRHFRTAQR